MMLTLSVRTLLSWAVVQMDYCLNTASLTITLTLSSLPKETCSCPRSRRIDWLIEGEEVQVTELELEERCHGQTMD